MLGVESYHYRMGTGEQLGLPADIGRAVPHSGELQLDRCFPTRLRLCAAIAQ